MKYLQNEFQFRIKIERPMTHKKICKTLKITVKIESPKYGAFQEGYPPPYRGKGEH